MSQSAARTEQACLQASVADLPSAWGPALDTLAEIGRIDREIHALNMKALDDAIAVFDGLRIVESDYE